MKFYRKTLLFCLIFISNNTFSQVINVSFSPTDDTYIQSNLSGGSNGALTRIYSGTNKFKNYVAYKRSFIEFNLSTIPPNAIICSADITLNVTGGVSGNNPFRTKLITSSWNESLLTLNNQPSVSNNTGDVSSIYSLSGSVLTLDVTSMTQRMINNQISNYGWCLQVLDETYAGTSGAAFHSKEAGGSLIPKLTISYYLPLSVSSAIISHESGIGLNDGSITPTITGGTGSFTYEWINGATGNILSTNSSISGLSYGWYGLHVTGTCNDELYQGFLVGTDCEVVDIDFITSKEYTDNAYVSNAAIKNRDGTWNLSENNNYGNSTIMKAADAYQSTNQGASYRGLHYNYLKYNLWMDSQLIVTKADLKLFGRSHYNFGNNATQFNKVTSTWDESAITYNNQPNSSNSILELVSATATSTENKTVDIIDFWEDWQIDNALNYGMKLGMQSYNNIDAWQDYHSPTSSTTLRRPVIEFTLDLRYENTPLFCRPELLPYNTLKRKLDGGYTYAYEHTIKFTFDEEYEQNIGEYLTINLYNENSEIIASCDDLGITTGGMTAFSLKFDDNRFPLDLSQISNLTIGEFYILEIFTSKGDKRYLKFLYKN